jgi:hypothetical protein
MVLSAAWFEFEDLAWDPLVGQEPVSASCNRICGLPDLAKSFTVLVLGVFSHKPADY